MKLKLEQQPPDKPSFLTVVLLAGAAIIILFVLALIVLRFGHSRVEHPLRGHPTSQLSPPSKEPGAPRLASETWARNQSRQSRPT